MGTGDHTRMKGTEMEIKRTYPHRGGKTNVAFGHIADMVFVAPDGEYTFNGEVIHPRGVEHLMNFCLQTLQDVYAGATDKADAIAKFATKYDRIVAGTIGAGGGGVSTLESEVFRMAMVTFKATHGKEAHKALGEKIPAEVRVVLIAFIGDDMDSIRETAQESLDRKAVEAQIRAEEMAELLNQRDSVDFDLAKFGL